MNQKKIWSSKLQLMGLYQLLIYESALFNRKLQTVSYMVYYNKQVRWIIWEKKSIL